MIIDAEFQEVEREIGADFGVLTLVGTGDGGESNVLIVTITDGTPSHTSQEVYGALKAKKVVFLCVDDKLIAVTHATSAEQVDVCYIEPVTLDSWQYSIVGDSFNRFFLPYEVPTDRELTSPTLPANAEVVGERFVEVDEKFGDVETALDTILAIQERLIGGDGQ